MTLLSAAKESSNNDRTRRSYRPESFPASPNLGIFRRAFQVKILPHILRKALCGLAWLLRGFADDGEHKSTRSDFLPRNEALRLDGLRQDRAPLFVSFEHQHGRYFPRWCLHFKREIPICPPLTPIASAPYCLTSSLRMLVRSLSQLKSVGGEASNTPLAPPWIPGRRVSPTTQAWRSTCPSANDRLAAPL